MPPSAPPIPPHAKSCFKAASNAGFTGIQILNHIDTEEYSEWRNLVDFDPVLKYGGWSYEDVVVRPAADAIAAVIKPGTKVRLQRAPAACWMLVA